jgi:hypothetical protein
MRIEGGAPGVVLVLCVLTPERAIVDRSIRRFLSQHPQYRWRVVCGGQGVRAVGGEDVADSPLLGHRASGDLQCSASHQDVAAVGGRRDHLELGGDRGFHQLTPLFGRG